MILVVRAVALSLLLSLVTLITVVPVAPPAVAQVDPNELSNGVAVEGLGGETSAELRFVFDVPASASSYAISMFGGGDADLYTRFGSEPTLADYDCRPYLDRTSEESCSFDSSQAGTVYILVRGYRSFSNVTLLASFEGAPPGVPAPVGPQTLIAEHSGLCLEMPNGSTSENVIVEQATCDGAADQQVTFPEIGGMFVNVRFEHSGKCMAVRDGSVESAALVVQAVCDDSPSSQWSLYQNSGGLRLVARHSAMCLDVFGDSTAPGTRLIQFPCGDADKTNQTFDSQPAAEPPEAGPGEWGPPIGLPLVPVASANLPDGRVLLWSAFAKGTFGGDQAKTQTAIWDPRTNVVTEREVAETGHDMFCPGVTNLPDGRILVSGGSSTSEASIYDPFTDEWIDSGDMNLGRGYQTNVTLADGRTLTFGGSWSGGEGNKFGEIWDNGNWQPLPGLQPENGFLTADKRGVYRSDNHMWLFAWGDRVFHAGPSTAMNWIDPSAGGSSSSAGTRGADPDAMNGSAVMFAPGMILTTGGAEDYNDSDARNSAYVIDITSGDAEVTQVDAMFHPRALHHSIVLPTGEVVVLGGQRRAKLFTDEQAVYEAEIFDPNTGTWSRAASMQIPRTYHSSALLLSDGRVMAGGGGLCGSCTTNHFDVEVFTPPYLVNADGSAAARPSLASAPASASYGTTFTVEASDAVAFSLVRMSNSTHGVNVEQRQVPLSIAGQSNNTFTLEAPTNGGIAPPGIYMLFALSAQGTPSIAEFIALG